MDLEAYDAWERHGIDVLARAKTPEIALAILSQEAASLRTWTPGKAPLHAVIAALDPDVMPGSWQPDLLASLRTFQRALLCIPKELRPQCPPLAELTASFNAHVARCWSMYGRIVNRFLAAHAFGSWVAYQGPGLDGWIRNLETALAVLLVACTRQCGHAGRELDRAALLASVGTADFLLRHLADRQALANMWTTTENVETGVARRRSRTARKTRPS
jgi:hypothetical protein